MPQEKPRLRKREIGFALAIGLFAAVGTALYLEESDVAELGNPPREMVAESGQLTYELASFDEVSTVGPQNVFITFGETISVRSEGSPQALDQLEAVVENGIVTIRPNDDVFRGNWGMLEAATFHITMPQLDRIALAGSGDVHVDRIEGERFEGTVGGSGEINIVQMDVQEAILGVFGSGDFTVAGTANETRVTIGGSGEVQGGGLRSTTASVSVGGSGNVALTVDEEARVSVTGSGDVDISGPAQCSVTQMGSGKVRCSGDSSRQD